MAKQVSDRRSRLEGFDLHAVESGPDPERRGALEAVPAGTGEASGIAYLIDVIQDLKRENQRYRALLGQLPVGVAVGEPAPGKPVADAPDRGESGGGDARFVDANEALSQLTGFARHEILGNDESLFQGARNDTKALLALASAKAEQRSVSVEMALHRKDGSVSPAAVTLAPVLDDFGNLQAFLTLIADRSESAEIERLRRELEAARNGPSDASSQFTANLIHELRTPLNAIIGFADVLQSEVFGNLPHPKCREYVADILESGKHLLELVNEILDLSKADVGRLELNESLVDVAAAIRTSTKMIERTAKTDHIELTVALAPDLPSLYADERRVRQILINLLANAVKFTPSGGEILLTADRDPDGGLFVSVLDTGVGIDAEDMPLAMAPFGQLDAGRRGSSQGTGLGLPLTKKLLEAHGGGLEVLSSVGQGTIMVARFPAERIVDEPAALTPP